ncbi:HAD family hydrolase [Streptomyces sp. B-S-A8]|uniref:HAD family hydrolase n=1 Tax=Streptomyces solicavernae TaxID=3043614 RepID=A0ABT6S0G4_9ACTN|nr:HAD family hydrolase [Streptomyces sp. B-S-A8]MDI3390179.1 HAD family hydrolase [Streptomyces sp. B-S-A8]
MLALFDLDNTLIDRQGGLDAWAADFARSRGLPETAAALVRTRLRDRAYPDDFVYLREALGLHDDAAELWREYIDGVARSAHCFPGVRQSLSALRAEGWTLGIATNGAVDIQRAKLDASGLAPLFDAVTISAGVGARKPERALFDAAATACGIPLSAGGWMVGDNPDTDIAGARAAGLQTVWVAGEREWTDGPHRPDIVVSSGAEAIEALRRWTS